MRYCEKQKKDGSMCGRPLMPASIDGEDTCWWWREHKEEE